MRALVQRVGRAEVRVAERLVGAIGSGLLIFLGVGQGDLEKDALWLAYKIAHLRVFSDEAGKMNRSLLDCGGALLVVSQFTLYGDCKKGHRPSFVGAMAPDPARELVARFVAAARAEGIAEIAQGEFGADMAVTLVNEGPVTLLLDSRADGQERQTPPLV